MAAPELDDQELAVLRALRSSPDSDLVDLAAAVGLPRTTFGRPLSRRLRQPVDQLVADGLVEQHGDRYRLSQRGRRALAELALDGII
jgi:DNA-binding IclR family transcriptional regulator